MGIEVPTLCYWEGVRPMNSCMLCVVREAKSGQLLPSCSTIVQDGMEIETDSGDVCNARKEVLELIVSEHVGDCEAPCTHTCPASMNIPVMMRQIYEGDLDGAAFTVTHGLVFPWTLGYVCPAPCENPCRRKQYDETMQIRELHKAVAEKALKENPELLECPPDTGKSVAVIGGGLAGMAAAWVLRKHGHACTLYEKEDKAGGKLRNLPPEELPIEVLDAEIEWVGRLGVNFEYRREIAGATALEDVVSQHDAVVVACKGVAEPGGKVFEAKEHKLHVRAVGNGKTTAQWVDRYLKCIDVSQNGKLFESKIGRMSKTELEIMRQHNENRTSPLLPLQRGNGEGSEPRQGANGEPSALQKAGRGESIPLGRGAGGMSVPTPGGDPLDSREEAGRCIHCDCRKRVTCGLRKWASEYNVETRKYTTTEERDFRIVGLGDVVFEPGKCIRCGLCVEIAKNYGEDIGIAFIGRGFEMEIQVPFNHTLDEGLKKSAAECVAACPTAAISFRNKEDIEQCHTTTCIEGTVSHL